MSKRQQRPRGPGPLDDHDRNLSSKNKNHPIIVKEQTSSAMPSSVPRWHWQDQPKPQPHREQEVQRGGRRVPPTRKETMMIPARGQALSLALALAAWALTAADQPEGTRRRGRPLPTSSSDIRHFFAFLSSCRFPSYRYDSAARARVGTET